MSSVNIRLTPTDEEILKALKKRGLGATELFRRILREEYRRQKPQPLTAKQIKQKLDAIDAAYPIPKGTPSLTVDTTDRHAVNRYIVHHLRSKYRR